VLAPRIAPLLAGSLLPLPSEIAIGEVPSGARIERQFRLANLSLRPVNLLAVTGGCGCVAAVVDSPRLLPFTLKTIQTSFTIAGTAGPIRREILVRVDDARRPYLTLSLHGRIAPKQRE
jgi:hypothetical protein